MSAGARFVDDGEAVPHTPVATWQEHPSYGARPLLDLTHHGEPCTRLVVLAAHPDDESLGAGGLIATAAAAGLSVYVALLTAGEASQYAAHGATRHALATLRLAEMENALARLAPDNFLAFLGAPDGAVAESEEQVARSLTDLLGDASRTLLAAPWRQDGHPDHDAAGRAAAHAARTSGARLVEYPLLAWTHRSPDELPWDDVLCLELSPALQEQKAAAIRAHVSQVRPPPNNPDGAPPLSGRVLGHFHTPFEHYLEAAPPAPS
ncbi:PIG-L family deacetylase [Nocardioides sp.]|uniref:PIG-L deacetylase family protein n=1 Tax=Nocardioides sp. TaxID=35761 RepID=UPI002B27A4B2|nr:PIG-L family deacetylase [Nocardioides sp.]